MQHTCTVCCAQFDSPRKVSKYCSNRCGAKASYERRRDAGTFSKAQYERTCVVCGKTWSTTNRPVKYCSQTCHYAVLYPTKTRRRQPPMSERMKAARRRQRAAARGTTGKGVLWTQGRCNRCGDPFVSRSSARWPGKYCSRQCKHADILDRRRARQFAASDSAEPVNRWRIFERDRYRCHICRRRTLPTKVVPHPRAPTLDHLMPIALGGRHEPANVACACFRCNSIKGCVGAGDQLALIG